MSYVRDRWMRPVSKDSKRKERTDRYGQGRRWQAVWDEGEKRVSKSFDTREAAEEFLADTSVSQRDGTYVARSKRDIPLAAMWPIWIASKAGKSKSTQDGYRDAWRRIEPRWGHIPCSQIDRVDVAGWIPTLTKSVGRQQLPLSESALRKIGLTIAALMDLAVEQRVIPANPLRRRDIPRQKETPRRYLAVDELDRLCAAAALADPAVELAVRVLYSTGVRPGEAFGFVVGDLSASRGRLRVARDVDKQGQVDETKTGRHRDVPIGGDLLLDVENAADGRDRGEPLLVDPRGRPWTLPRWRIYWERITVSAGLAGLDTYELRHTAVSLAIHSGANVKTIQRMVGHASAAITLNVYGHLWDSELDLLPAAVEAHVRAERQRFAERRARTLVGRSPDADTGSNLRQPAASG